MSFRPAKNDCSRVTLIVELVNKQKVSSNVTFAEPFPVAFKPVIFPSVARGPLLEINNNITSMRRVMSNRPEWDKSLPVFQKVFRKV